VPADTLCIHSEYKKGRTMHHESPFLQVGIPARNMPMMVIRRERAAMAAMTELRHIGANPLPTHRLPNKLGFIAPDTGREHGPQR
jgi:hypothetical protein